MKQLKVFFTVALLTCPLSAIVPASGASPPVIIDVPGATGTVANGINNAGQIVGIFHDAKGTHGFLRTAEGDFTTIDAPGATGTIANGINNAGQVVGSFQDASGTHGFLRTAEGTFTAINAPGAVLTTATGINDAGQIVGAFHNAGEQAQNNAHGFLRTIDGAFTIIKVPDAVFTLPHGINNADQVVGEAMSPQSNAGGFLWTTRGAVTFVNVPRALAGPPMPNVANRDVLATAAMDINNAGWIVGQFMDTSLRWRGFVRTAGGTFTSIDMPYTLVHGINDAGQIVGTFRDSGGSHGFLQMLPTATPTEQPARREAIVTWTTQQNGPQVRVSLQVVVPAPSASGVRQAVKIVSISGDGHPKTVYDGVHDPGDTVSVSLSDVPPFIIQVYVGGSMVKQITVPAGG